MPSNLVLHPSTRLRVLGWLIKLGYDLNMSFRVHRWLIRLVSDPSTLYKVPKQKLGKQSPNTERWAIVWPTQFRDFTQYLPAEPKISHISTNAFPLLCHL